MDQEKLSNEFYQACISGNLETAQALYNGNIHETVTPSLLDETYMNGHIEVSDWLCTIGFHLYSLSDLIRYLCEKKDLDTLKIVYKSTNEHPYFLAMFVKACINNSLDILKMLYDMDPMILVYTLKFREINSVTLDDVYEKRYHDLGLDNDTIENLRNIRNNKPLTNTDNIHDIVIHALFWFNQHEQLDALALPYVSYEIVNGKVNGVIKRLKNKSAAKIVANDDNNLH